MKANQLTKLQKATIFLHVKGAARECGEDPETYRKRIMREELGVDHLSEVSRTTGFDKLMRRIFEDRGEYSRALDYVAGDEKRLRHLALGAAKAIVAERGSGTPDEMTRTAFKYVAGVMVQMRMSYQTVDSLAIKLQRPDGWDDLTSVQLRKVVSALQVHIRRRH